MRWESLTSAQNLRLAWRRINTARNLQYKRFFRDAFLAYEAGLDDHLRELRRALRSGTWTPSHAARIYLPKPSGLQRPLSLLQIEDQIVLQAIANMFAKRLGPRRKPLELTVVFSNVLSDEPNSLFFMQRWQRTYREFDRRCRQLYRDGYRWAAEFDLASYYDTISHDLLLSIESKSTAQSKATEFVANCLKVWSSGNAYAMTGHGIPQGPIASDFLAEVFLLPIDRKMSSESFGYLRYVDDIRLFGKSENDVRRASIALEQEVRHRGLIPQGDKFKISPLTREDEASGSLPSLTPHHPDDEAVLDAAESLALIRSSVSGRPLRISDRTPFRYAVYRAPADTRILDLVLKLLPRHPEHIDAFSAFLGNFKHRPRIARAALGLLQSDLPYSYVRGELWHLVARLAAHHELKLGLPLAQEDARRRRECAALSWGVMHFLIRCHEQGVARYGSRLASEAPISRSLLAPVFPDHEFQPGGNIVRLLTGTVMEQLAGARELQRRGISLRHLNLRQSDLPRTAVLALKSLGVISRAKPRDRDWIAERLRDLYACARREVWHRLLTDEYEHALQILIEAGAYANGRYSEWLLYQDTWNDVVTRKLVELLHQRGRLAGQRLIARNKTPISYGSLLAPGAPLDALLPTVASRFRDIHRRRNQLPGAYPYDEKGGQRNRFLKAREHRQLSAKQRVAINDLTAFLERSY